jgi:hypothetical protein
MYYPRLHYPNPVTGAPVQYPPGTATTESHSLTAAVPLSPPKTTKEFTARLTELERQVDSSIAYDAVENLVSANGYYLENSEDARAVHQSVQPVINLAPDGKSATIRARLLKVDGEAAGFASGTYEGRAIKRNGVWELQGLMLKPTWSSAFNQWMPLVERQR